MPLVYDRETHELLGVIACAPCKDCDGDMYLVATNHTTGVKTYRCACLLKEQHEDMG